MPDFAPTEEQAAIVASARQGGNHIITAYAGCAKSTTLELVARDLPPTPSLYVVFNKKNKIEAEKKFPQHFKIMTLNGLGHLAWMRTIGKSPQLDDRKLGKIVSQLMKDHSYRGDEDAWQRIRELVTRAMLAGLVPSTEQHVGLTPDSPESWSEINSANSIDATPREIELARLALIASIGQAYGRSGPATISFDDQIYCSTMLGGAFPRYPLVMVDESQDLSILNHIQVRRSASADLCAVGDPKQAIYAFRGADSDSMSKMRSMRKEWRELPLATTFRCPKAIVERQQDHAPGFRAWHTNPEGKIGAFRRPEGAQEWSGWTWADVQAEVAELPNGRTTAVICRNNAPLLKLAFLLLRQNVGVYMMGRDIGKSLVALARKIAPEDTTPADVLNALIRSWMDREIELATLNGNPEREAGIRDRGESLLAVLEASRAPDAGELRRSLTYLFSRETGVVTLSSGHRAKGLEWDLVVHLDPWRIPSKFATQAALRGDRRQLQQELNLRYVIETRAKHTLINASLEDFPQ